MRTENGVVATKPLTDGGLSRSRRVAGMDIIDEKVSLAGLTTVFDSRFGPVGTFVYIDPGAAANQQWSKNVYSLGGVEFILVPESAVILVDGEDW